MRHLVALAMAGSLAAGCGGGQSSTTETAADVEGTQHTDETPEEETSGHATPPPPATGPGRLRVVNRVGGSDSSGTVRVMNDAGEVVAQGNSGDTFDLEAGSYRIAGSITDQAVMFDRPTRDADGAVTVLAGQETTVGIDFPVSRVRLRVTRGGRPVGRWRAELRRQNGDGSTLELRSSEDYIPVTPGRYDGTLIFGNTRIDVNNVIFQGGARMDVPVNIN